MQRGISTFKNYSYPFFFIVVALFIFSSCRVTKPTAYFETLKRDTTINHFVDTTIESKIVVNDLLSIKISSLNREEDLFYNTIAAGNATSGGGGGTLQGYTVDANGNVQLHNLGEVHVEGMTRKQLKDSLEIALLPYLKDPIVTVSFLNRRITVLGQISDPQVITMQQEQLSLLEVLATCGDVTDVSLKRDILIIRPTPTGKVFKHINLQDESIFNKSYSWYYLQAGDIVYVEPDLKRIYNEKQYTRSQQNLAFVLAGLSLVLIIISITHSY